MGTERGDLSVSKTWCVCVIQDSLRYQEIIFSELTQLWSPGHRDKHQDTLLSPLSSHLLLCRPDLTWPDLSFVYFNNHNHMHVEVVRSEGCYLSPHTPHCSYWYRLSTSHCLESKENFSIFIRLGILRNVWLPASGWGHAKIIPIIDIIKQISKHH